MMIRSKGLSWTAELATIGAFVIPVIALFSPAVRKWWKAPVPVSQLSLDEAVERLSPVLLTQWTERNNERQVHDPGAMRVEFKVTRFTRSLMTTVSLGDDPEVKEKLRPANLSGNFDSILDVFRKVQRLVITGPAGSGKSVLAVKLACDLAGPQGTSPREPTHLQLPLVLQASAWKPGESLDQWITSELVSIDPELSLRPRGAASKKVTLAQAMASSRVIPIIDGIDELPGAFRGELIRRVNEAGSNRPLVVTSRPAEYAGALAVAGREISRAAVVEMQELTLPAVRRYLREAATPLSLPRWQLVFTQLKRAPGGPLAAVLTNPLMLWLCRRIYSQDDHDPGELVESPYLGNLRAIEDHLLDAFLPAIYRDTDGRPSRWTAAQARQWLSFLASFMEKTRSPDLAWWRLRTTIAGWQFLLEIVRGASLSALVCWLAVWVLRRSGHWQGGHYTGRASPASLENLLLGGPAGEVIRPGIHRAVAISVSLFFPPLQQPPSNATGLLSIVPWPVYIIVPGTIMFIIFSRKYGAGGSPVPIASIRLKESSAETLGMFIFQFIAVIGIIEITLHLPHRAMAGKGPTMLGLSVLAIIFIAIFFVPGYFRLVPAELYIMTNPVMLLRGDRRVCFYAAAIALIPVAAIWCCCGTSIGEAVCAFGCAFLLSELTIGLLASGAFVPTRAWLALTHRMPLRTLAFLEDAHERGALSRTGSTYQFRHLRLQRHLARDDVQPPHRLAWNRLGSLIRGYHVGLPPETGTWSHHWWARCFQEQADALAGVIGFCEATGPVYDEPPGVAQRFGTADGRDWVMCALPGAYPVLVPDSLWDLLHDIRAAAGGGNALEALGFPTLPAETPAGQRLIVPGASRLTLASGALGQAALERARGGGDWRWCPQASMEFTEQLVPPGRRKGRRVQVRVRLPCNLPEPFIDWSLTRQLEDQLSTSEFSSMMSALGPLDEGYPRAARARGGSRYRWRTSIGSTPPIEASISVTPRSSELDVSVELDITAGECAQADSSLRLGLRLEQLQAALQAAWSAAADAIPGVILGDPLGALTAQPHVSLLFSAPSTPEEILRLKPWGFRKVRRPEPGMFAERTVTISGPVVSLSDVERERYIRDALASLAPGFGYQPSAPA